MHVSPTGCDRHVALLVIGPRASGKSTVARAVAARLSWGYASFGSYVRDQSRGREAGPSSLRLEEAGHRLIAERGAAGLLADVLASQETTVENMVLDGVRHNSMLEAVNALYQKVISIYLEVSEQLRSERWLQREGLTNSAGSLRLFEQLSRAGVERHVFALRPLATITLDGSRPIDELVEQAINLICS